MIILKKKENICDIIYTFAKNAFVIIDHIFSTHEPV